MLALFALVTSLTTTEILTPAAAVQAALARDPALAARVAEMEAARGLKRDVFFLGSNPEVSVSVSQDQLRVSGSITQPLSITGEGIHAGRAAGSAVTAATAMLDRARFETAASARRAYARAIVARELLSFAEADRALLARLLGVAEARLAAGEGADLDVRLARLEQARAIAAWLDAKEKVAQADVELAVLIGLAPKALLRDPLSAGPVDSGATAPRSDIIAARAATRSAKAALAREKAAVLPSIGFGAFYEEDEGRKLYGPAITLEVPLWNWNRAGVGAARGNLKLAEALEVAAEARAATETAHALERLRAADESIALLGTDIASEAGPARFAIEKLFTSGESNLADVLLLRSRVVEGERAWIEARAAVAIARIDAALANQSSGLLP